MRKRFLAFLCVAALTFTSVTEGPLVSYAVSAEGQTTSAETLVNAGVMITTQPTDVETTSGNTITFTVVAEGVGLKYQWQVKNDENTDWKSTTLTGAKTATLSVYADTSKSGRQYRCVVKDSAGNEKISEAATLTVVAAPKITAQPTDVETGEGKKAIFRITATGTGLKYQWQVKAGDGAAWKNTTLAGAKTDVLTVMAELSKSGKKYRCVVTDKFNRTVVSSSAVLTVRPSASITKQPEDVIVDKAQTVRFTVEAQGDGLRYQWQTLYGGATEWKNTTVTGYNTPTLKVAATQDKSGRQYRCVVTDQYGKRVNSNAATLTFKAPDPYGDVVYRALLIGEESFNPVCKRNSGDVVLMDNMLKSVTGGTGGSYVGNITMAYDQSVAQIKSLITTSFANADENDVSMFFIATHGDSTHTGYTAGSLATIESDGSVGHFRLGDLATCLSAVPGRVIVILESCGSGAAIYEEGVEENLLDANADEADEAFMTEVINTFAAYDVPLADAGEGTDQRNVGDFRKSKFYVLCASRFLELSWGTESTYYGPCNYFTRWLTDGVGTSGSMPGDTDNNGKMTLHELFTYIKVRGDEKTFYSGGEYYQQHVQVYPTNSDYVMFQR